MLPVRTRAYRAGWDGRGSRANPRHQPEAHPSLRRLALALVVSAETVNAADFTDPAAVFMLVPNGTVTAMTALP